MLQTIQKTRQFLGIPPKTIVLTFDDGPVSGGGTSALLDLLESEEIHAGFCLVGRRIPGNEQLLRRIYEGGHLIVNHGDWHRIPDHLTDQEFLDDLTTFDRRVAEALAMPQWKSHFFRPPGGCWNARLGRLLANCGKSVMPITYFAWDIMPFPLRAKVILAGMLMNLRKRNGGIYLLHEAMVPLHGECLPAPPRHRRPWLVPLVHQFVSIARQEGFHFVRPQDVDWELVGKAFQPRAD